VYKYFYYYYYYLCYTIPNFVALGHTVLAYVGVPKILGPRGPAPWVWDVSDPLKARFFPTYVTVPNSVILGQTVRA